MTPFDNRQDGARLLRRARLAYEIGGLRLGLSTAWPVLPLLLLACRCCGPQVVTLSLALILLVGTVGLVAVSRELHRAVRLGLLAGGLCAGLPMAVMLLQLCSVVGCRPMAQFCLYGGLLGGAILGHRALRIETPRARFLIVAGGVAALTGAIGCVVAGVAGVLGMALGVVFASAPFLLYARAR
jgi:hypothetical protein